MKLVCRPRSYLRLCRWPALVHPLLALAVLGSGCAAGGADTADEAATPAGRGTSNVVSSSGGTPPANAATTPPSNTPSAPSTPATSTPATSTPATSSASEAPAVSTLTPTGNGSAQIGDEDDQDDDDDVDVDDQDDDRADDDRDDDEDEDDGDGDGGDDDDDGDVTPPAPGAGFPAPGAGFPAPGAGFPAPGATPVTFTNEIRSLLVENCGRCHASGGLPAFASANANTAFNVAVSERNAIVREITAGDMPADTCNGGAPGTAGCVSTADLALIRAWIAAGTPQ